MTVTVTLEPGAIERIFTIALSASTVLAPLIAMMIEPAGIPAFSAPSPVLRREIFAPIPV